MAVLFPSLTFWRNGNYRMHEAILVSPVVTSKVKIVLLTAKQRLYCAEPITLSVLKSDMTTIIQQWGTQRTWTSGTILTMSYWKFVTKITSKKTIQWTLKQLVAIMLSYNSLGQNHSLIKHSFYFFFKLTVEVSGVFPPIMYNVVVAYLTIQVLMALIFALKAHYLFCYHPNFWWRVSVDRL